MKNGILLFILICLIAAGYCRKPKRVNKKHNFVNLGASRGRKEVISSAPFMVGILVREELPHKLGDWKFLCGGAIITPFNVLTTASCISYLVEEEMPKADMMIRSNTEYWDCDCGRATDHTIYDYAIHPDFKPTARMFHANIYQNDIGFITVNERFSNQYEKSINFTIDSEVNMYLVFGWGSYFTDSTRTSSQLQSVLINNILYHDECLKIFRRKLPKELFCQEVSQHSGEPCAHDNGGPLVGSRIFARRFMGTEWNKLSLGIVGLISSPGDCGQISPLYLNMSHYGPWVTKMLSSKDHVESWYKDEDEY